MRLGLVEIVALVLLLLTLASALAISMMGRSKPRRRPGRRKPKKSCELSQRVITVEFSSGARRNDEDERPWWIDLPLHERYQRMSMARLPLILFLVHEWPETFTTAEVAEGVGFRWPPSSQLESLREQGLVTNSDPTDLHGKGRWKAAEAVVRGVRSGDAKWK